jgi:hypothetical protein
MSPLYLRSNTLSVWEKPEESVSATGKTSTVCTPPASGVGIGATLEDHVEYTEEEKDHASAFDIHWHRPQRDEDFDWPWEEIGPSQLEGAPRPTQGDVQV